MAVLAKPSWDVPEGVEIAPGRSVVKRLGGGRRYEVFLVWDERLLSLAVAKVLRPDRVDDEPSLAAFGRESDLLHRLAHPSLVRALDVVPRGEHPHVLLEHADGINLRRLLRRHGPLPLEQLLPIVREIAAALHYLAAEGVVHLDVKPANIVMVAPPRLIDLGSARTIELAAERKKPIGTAAYMAPEQCAPTPGAIGPPADVWGLGATLHHAIAGAPPFAARDGERFAQLGEDAPPLPRGVPRQLASLVEQMLARSAGDRPAAGDVFAALESLDN